MDNAILKAAKAADEQITAIHAAFGAPGDHGYESREGKALYGLYKFQAELRTAIRDADRPVSGPMEFNKPEPADKDAEALEEMSAQIWAAGASREDSELISRMLWRNGFIVAKREG